MSSALDCNDFDARNVGNEENMYPLTNWTRWVVDLPVKADYLRNASGRGPFSYCTGGTLLLGQVVQRAVRKPLDQYFDERLFRPLGIRERQWSAFARRRVHDRRRPAAAQPRSAQARHPGDQEMAMARRASWCPQAWVRRMQTLSNVVNDQQSYGMLKWQREYASPCGRVNGWSMSGNGGNAVVSVPLKSHGGGGDAHAATTQRGHARQKPRDCSRSMCSRR